MRSLRRLSGQEGAYALLSAVLLIGAASIATLALVALVARHHALARGQADAIAALHLARGGVLQALVAIQEGVDGGTGLPPQPYEGNDGDGTYRVTWTIDDDAFRLDATSIGSARNATSELAVSASWPPRAALLADRDVTVRHSAGAGGDFTVRGNVFAGREAKLAAEAGRFLTSEGDVRGAQRVRLTARDAAGTPSTLRVTGEVRAGTDIVVEAAGESQVLIGSETTGSAPVPDVPALPLAPYEDARARLVACDSCEQQAGRYPSLVIEGDPGKRFPGDVTVDGDMVVRPGATAVVEGDLTVDGKLTVNGLLYIRGDLHAGELGTPGSGGVGTLAAIGNIRATRLALSPDTEPVPGALVVLALTAGPDDPRDSLRIRSVTGTGSQLAGVLLYSGGDVTIELDEAEPPERLPLCAAAGRDLELKAALAAPSGTVLYCEDLAWRRAPAPLRALWIVTPRSWKRVR